MATILPGVRPIIRLASTPTATIWPLFVLSATTDGSFSTIPRPRTYTRVFAVPRSTAMSRPRNASGLAMRMRAFQPNYLLNHVDRGYRARPRQHLVIPAARERADEPQKVDLDCRSADSGEPQPCAMLYRTFNAWSPRIVPGAALTGSTPPPAHPGPSPTSAGTLPCAPKSVAGNRSATRKPLQPPSGTGPARLRAPPARRAAGRLARTVHEGQDAPPGIGAPER